MTLNYSRFYDEAAMPLDGATASGPGLPSHPAHRTGIYRNWFKRGFDIALVLISAPFVVPLVLCLAVLVARDGGMPFYAQLRVGKGGRIFRMWKLRSMVVDADERMAAHLANDPEARREWDSTQKLRSDPRITPFGRFLRKSSLDELPQLWNVLTGDMSIVGPRPMMPSQQSIYPGTAYFAVRPGITGFWQTAGRNKTTFAARAYYDAEYEKNLSASTDAKILLRTVGVVLSCSGY